MEAEHSNSMTDKMFPNKQALASSYTTTKPDKGVHIRTESSEFLSFSVPNMVKNHCLAGGSKTALAIMRNGNWVKWNYDQYYSDIKLTAKAFIKLGLDPFYTVCIYSFNCPEWFISNLGAIFAGGLSAGLYPTNSSSTNEYLMNNSRCQILVVENLQVLRTISHILKNVTTLKKIVVIEEDGFRPGENLILWKDLLELGRKEGIDRLNDRLSHISVNQCCSLIYTSGTTGNPKGVMLSHDIITFMTKAIVKKHDWTTAKFIVVSYLPLSHIAASFLDIYVALYLKGEVYFADKYALKGSLVDTLKEVRPTMFFGVPRVWEKFQEGIKEQSKNQKKSQMKVAQMFKDASMHYYENGDQKVIHKIGDKLIFQKVKQALGLDRCLEFISGGAPLSERTRDFFLSLDIPVQECYGLSECGIFCSVQKSDFKTGTCGTIIPSTHAKVVKSSDDDIGGEICIKGRCVMMGYLFNEQATSEAFDKEGYFHTGDVGVRDKNGHYRITGRLKDLLLTSGGENVAPAPIENAIKHYLPVVSNAVVVGDAEKFISVCLTIKVKSNEDGEPTSELTDSVKKDFKNLGCNYTTVGEILYHKPPGVMKAIQKGIDEANKRAISNAAKVKKWCILPRELSLEAGEIGPTLKLIRKVFTQKHSKLIHELCS
uniref:long-chain-fatty-acid--CoA ligase n=1 Tax=Lepeophtheirus salmonis TaxID=72036 RepID=A0A0K2TMK5_LEPSM